MSLTKKEIMGLSKLTEAEQITSLLCDGIIKTKKGKYLNEAGQFVTINITESLSDCADRLWREAVKNHSLELCVAVIDVFSIDVKVKHDINYIERWALYHFLPIHRIQAALLAGEGK